MSLAPAIYSRLTTDTPVSTLVGDRVFPRLAPQQETTYPQLVYELEDQEPVSSYAGNTANLASQAVIIACIGRTIASVEAVADAVRASLDQQDGVWGGVDVTAAYYEGENPTTENGGAGQDDLFHIIELRFRVWFRPS